MGTLPFVSAPRMTAALLALVTAAACGIGGNSGNAPTHSPSAAQSSPSQQASASPSGGQASPSPQPITGAYGVLLSSQASSSYTVSIVSVDGRVVASASASTPPPVSCANAAAGLVANPISISNTRVYFMDAQGVVRFLGPGGDTGQATSVPAGSASRRSMFAVSPDDQRIAVIVDDFNSSGATTRLYVENLTGGGNHLDLFSETGAFTLWPTGWHGINNLVVGKIAACTQGGGPFCCGPYAPELHVVDPATAARRFTLGGSGCTIVGPPTPAGAVCWDQSATTLKILNWTATVIGGFSLGVPEFQYLSPDGSVVAQVNNTGTYFVGNQRPMNGLFACTWVDNDHILSGGDPQHQPRLGTVSTNTIVPVAAQGDCGGRLPGGL